MLNHISVTPREKRPRVISSVVAHDNDDDEAILVDPENAGPFLQATSGAPH